MAEERTAVEQQQRREQYETELVEALAQLLVAEHRRREAEAQDKEPRGRPPLNDAA